MKESTESLTNEVRGLVALYGNPLASASNLLCDRHDPQSLAYSVIASDMSARELTYGTLRLESAKLAAGLWTIGLRPGDRIATLMGKSCSYLVTVMAIWRLGAVHVPLFTAFGPEAIAFRLAASACKLVVCDASQRAKLPARDGSAPQAWKVVSTARGEDAVALDELLQSAGTEFGAAALGGDAPVVQIYTSGTTGSPKGVILPLRGLASIHAYAKYGLGLLPSDLFWNAADPGWAYGLYFGVLATFVTGVPSILYEGGFSAEATWAILASRGVTNFAAAPTAYRSLRASGLCPSAPLRLRCASSAGEPLTADVNEWAISALGVEVYDHYGQTEAGMLINNHHHPALKRTLMRGSMGCAMPGWTSAILKCDSDEPAPIGEVGRLAMDLPASPLAWFNGYTDGPERSQSKFSANRRWYLTGDLARMEETGYTYFASRDDDIIIMAGYRIGPNEVESTLMSHEAVAECAVVAVPDAIRGEVLEAVVVLRAGHRPTADLSTELQSWVKARYAAHAYPRRVHYVCALPRTPSGKVQRFILRQQLAQGSLQCS